VTNTIQAALPQVAPQIGPVIQIVTALDFWAPVINTTFILLIVASMTKFHRFVERKLTAIQENQINILSEFVRCRELRGSKCEVSEVEEVEKPCTQPPGGGMPGMQSRLPGSRPTPAGCAQDPGPEVEKPCTQP
jgi:hypothetical protein